MTKVKGSLLLLASLADDEKVPLVHYTLHTTLYSLRTTHYTLHTTHYTIHHCSTTRTTYLPTIQYIPYITLPTVPYTIPPTVTHTALYCSAVHCTTHRNAHYTACRNVHYTTYRTVYTSLPTVRTVLYTTLPHLHLPPTYPLPT